MSSNWEQLNLRWLALHGQEDVWKQTKDEFVYPKYESIGAIHHVVMVTVSPGDSILVDWSIGQFRTKSICDAMLFITI